MRVSGNISWTLDTPRGLYLKQVEVKRECLFDSNPRGGTWHTDKQRAQSDIFWSNAYPK